MLLYVMIYTVAPVAQSVEHLTFNQRVRSSSLRRSTKKSGTPLWRPTLFVAPVRLDSVARQARRSSQSRPRDGGRLRTTSRSSFIDPKGQNLRITFAGTPLWRPTLFVAPVRLDSVARQARRSSQSRPRDGGRLRTTSRSSFVDPKGQNLRKLFTVILTTKGEMHKKKSKVHASIQSFVLSLLYTVHLWYYIKVKIFCAHCLCARRYYVSNENAARAVCFQTQI